MSTSCYAKNKEYIYRWRVRHQSEFRKSNQGRYQWQKVKRLFLSILLPDP